MRQQLGVLRDLVQRLASGSVGPLELDHNPHAVLVPGQQIDEPFRTAAIGQRILRSVKPQSRLDEAEILSQQITQLSLWGDRHAKTLAAGSDNATAAAFLRISHAVK